MIKKLGTQNLEDSEIEAVNYIRPNDKYKGFIGRSKDYIVIMHFS